MNRKAITIAATLALTGLTACQPVPHVAKHVVTNVVTAPADPPCPDGQILVSSPELHCIDAGPAQDPVNERQPSLPGPITPAYVATNCPEALAAQPNLAVIARYCPWLVEAWALNSTHA